LLYWPLLHHEITAPQTMRMDTECCSIDHYCITKSLHHKLCTWTLNVALLSTTASRNHCTTNYAHGHWMLLYWPLLHHEITAPQTMRMDTECCSIMYFLHVCKNSLSAHNTRTSSRSKHTHTHTTYK